MVAARFMECYQELGHMTRAWGLPGLGLQPTSFSEPTPGTDSNGIPVFRLELLRAAASNRSISFARYWDAAAAERLRRVAAAEEIDAVIAEHAYMAPYAAVTGHMFRVNAHLIEHRWPVRPRILDALRETNRLRTEELAWYARGAPVSVLDREEESYLSNAKIRSAYIPVTFRPLPSASASARSSHVAGFLGSRRWKANQLAVERILRVWPEIRRRAPGSQLLIAGDDWPKRRDGDSVTFMGRVPSSAEFFQQITVQLAPLDIGGGVRVKILEAAQHGTPTVSTPIGIGGLIEYLPSLVPANRDDEFVREAAHLLLDPARARRIGLDLKAELQVAYSAQIMEEAVSRWLQQ